MEIIFKLKKDYPDLPSWRASTLIEYEDSLANLINETLENLADGDDFGVFLNAPRLERFALINYIENKSDLNWALENKITHRL